MRGQSFKWLNDDDEGYQQPLHDEVGPADAVWIFPRVSAEHDDLCDPPVHGHQGGDGLPRQGQHLGSAVTNNAELVHGGKFGETFFDGLFGQLKVKTL